MSYYYLNTYKSHDTLVCDFLDLAGDGLDKATAQLVAWKPSLADADPQDMENYAIDNRLMFEEDGTIHQYADNAEWSRVYHLDKYNAPSTDHPDCPGLIPFADLPDGSAIAAATLYLWEEGLLPDEYQEGEPENVPYDVARLAANIESTVFTYDGRIGRHTSECRIVDSIDL